MIIHYQCYVCQRGVLVHMISDTCPPLCGFVAIVPGISMVSGNPMTDEASPYYISSPILVAPLY